MGDPGGTNMLKICRALNPTPPRSRTPVLRIPRITPSGRPAAAGLRLLSAPLSGLLAARSSTPWCRATATAGEVSPTARARGSGWMCTCRSDRPAGLGRWSSSSTAAHGTAATGRLRFVGEALASRGMVAVVADYRLIPRCATPTSWRTARAPRVGARQRRQWAAPAAGVRDGPQRRRLQRGHAGAGRALAGGGGHAPRESRAGSAWPGPTTSCRSATPTPSRCFHWPDTRRHQPIDHRRGAAAHAALAGPKTAGRSAAQHGRPGAATGGGGRAGDARLLDERDMSPWSAPSASRCAGWRRCWTTSWLRRCCAGLRRGPPPLGQR